uniref:BTB domain-containing protein n=1 Tax=Glossina brevipalpis TaxID=37001 RepID=A0A1A9WZN7_9MUSC
MAVNGVTSATPMYKHWGQTKRKLIKFSYEWTIDNFRLWCVEERDSLESPNFFTNDNHKLEWRLRLSISEGYIYFCVELIKDITKSGIKARCEFSVLNATGEKVNLKTLRMDHYKSGNIQKWVLLSVAELLKNHNDLLPEDKLTIFCEMCLKEETINISSQSKAQMFKTPDIKLNEDLGNLFHSAKFADVTLAADGGEFQAHKNILSARSDVFAAMFEHDMEERKLNRVAINDINHEVLKEMVRFIYTGEAPNLDKMADKLLAAADKYALESLKGMCAEVLYAKLSAQNAAEILILADLHNVKQLKAETISFINNIATEFVETEGWKNMITTHSYLITEMFQAFANKHVL